MTSLESYSMCPANDLSKHLVEIDVQCQSALDLYNSLCAQRGIVLQALGIRALETAVESPTDVQAPTSAVA